MKLKKWERRLFGLPGATSTSMVKLWILRELWTEKFQLPWDLTGPLLGVPISLKNSILWPIGEIKIPILDIYGEEDLGDVRRGIDDRRLAASKNKNDAFRQIELKHAGHNYLGVEMALVEQIQHWLQQTLPAIDQSRRNYEISP